MSQWAPICGLFALAGITVVSGLLLMPGRSAADPLRHCSPTSGVVVAVDFEPWGSRIESGCDPRPTTGYEALHVAGFTTSGDAQDGAAFICRINDLPPPSQDACLTTPPASQYWSYWHADAGQARWTYSQLGAASYRPPPGSVDAWVFGSTNLSGAGGYPPFTPGQVRTVRTATAAGDANTGDIQAHARNAVTPRQAGSFQGFAIGAAVVATFALLAAVVAWRRKSSTHGDMT